MKIIANLGKNMFMYLTIIFLLASRSIVESNPSEVKTKNLNFKLKNFNESNVIQSHENSRNKINSHRIKGQNNLPESKFRIGHGYDIHQLSRYSTKPLIISGIRIKDANGVIAHSDGDVVLHSVFDAIFGALALPDIGQQFSDSDPRWENVSSSMFMEEAQKTLKMKNVTIVNIDITVILQSPKLASYREEMRKKLSELLQIDVSQVNIKFRTHENLDSVGKSKAVECCAVTLLSIQ